MNEPVLAVENLCKTYPGFSLRNVSFSLQPGEIMGFIGRNGSGKTTTIKAILGLVYPQEGQVRMFGLPFAGNERAVKQHLGYAAGAMACYPRKRLGDIAAAIRPFYAQWDEKQYRRCLSRFHLEENRRVLELSEGMKVKFNLTLALAHRAELLLLDEPTSGLDPVSREELLEIFLDLAQEGVAILFSTHITSDLTKCADSITYIRQGQIVASQSLPAFTQKYRLLTLERPPANRPDILGLRRSKTGYTALVLAQGPGQSPDLETIMSHLEAEHHG